MPTISRSDHFEQRALNLVLGFARCHLWFALLVGAQQPGEALGVLRPHNAV